MFSNIYLDVALGLIFIFLIYSLLVTAIQELISSFLNFRGKVLYKAIRQMLLTKSDDILAKKFYNHPLIQKLTFNRSNKYPSYLNSETFARIAKDILPNLYLGKGKELSFEERMELLPEGDLKTTINAYIQEKSKSLDETLEQWFDETMDRITGYYKRIIQRNLFILGFAVAIIFNVDSISLFSKLSKDDKARERVVNQAIKFMNEYPNFDSILIKKRTPMLEDSVRKINPGKDSLGRKGIVDSILKSENDSLYNIYNDARNQLTNLLKEDIEEVNNTLGIGWKSINFRNENNKFDLVILLKIILGWIVTGLAITLGSPFWFDLLKRLIQIRGTGTRPQTLAEKKAGEKK